MSTKKKALKFFILRTRQPDGNWIVDPEPRTKKETEYLQKLGRIWGGMTSQIWSAEEAIAQGFEINEPECQQ